MVHGPWFLVQFFILDLSSTRMYTRAQIQQMKADFAETASN
jgi:hypothetical protein